MRRAYKFRAYPAGPQEGRAARLMRDHCDLYNAALEERREAWGKRRVSIFYGGQSAQLRDIRAADPAGQGRHSFTAQQQTLRRHDWHGDWNCTLYPAPPAPAPAPAPRPGRGERPGRARPALTGMTASDWELLTAALAVPYQAQREADRHIARGGSATRGRAGGHPQAMTLAEKTLVTIMRQRLAVPRPVLADLLGA